MHPITPAKAERATNGAEWRPIEPVRAADCVEVWGDQRSGETQYFEESIATASGSTIEVRLGYRRIREFDANNKTGQDSAAVLFDDRHVVAVVADGVSQSFFGDLAAKHLSAWLLGELWRRRLDPPGKAELERGLREQQGILAEKVDGLPLEELGDSDLMRLALDKTRREWGSQAVFTACSLVLPGLRGYIYEVGDALAVLEDEGGTRTIRADPHGRWSTTGKSDLLLSRMAVNGAASVVMKTDGADKRWGLEADAGRVSGDLFFQMANRRAEYDDVCFVSVCSAAPGDPVAPSPTGLPLGEGHAPDGHMPSMPEADRRDAPEERQSRGSETPVAHDVPPAAPRAGESASALPEPTKPAAAPREPHAPAREHAPPRGTHARWAKPRLFVSGFICGSIVAAALIITAPRLKAALDKAFRLSGSPSDAIDRLDERVSSLERALNQLRGSQSPSQSEGGAKADPADADTDKSSSIGISVVATDRDRFKKQYDGELSDDLRSFIEESSDRGVIRILVVDVSLARMELDQGSGSSAKKSTIAPVKPGTKPVFVKITGTVKPGTRGTIRLFDRRGNQVADSTFPMDPGQCYGIAVQRGDR